MLNYKFIILLAGIVLYMSFTVGCSDSEKSTEKANDTVEEDMDLYESPQYPLFLENYPDKAVFTYIVGDCNDDGIDDLTIVYRENSSSNHLVTLYSKDDGFSLTEPIPAPVDSCTLQWKDVDEKPPIELLVSGQKGIHFGYGVFRFVDNEWISLYGDMVECC